MKGKTHTVKSTYSMYVCLSKHVLFIRTYMYILVYIYPYISADLSMSDYTYMNEYFYAQHGEKKETRALLNCCSMSNSVIKKT